MSEEKIDENGEEIDNPVSFKDTFNKAVAQYIRGTCQSQDNRN